MGKGPLGGRSLVSRSLPPPSLPVDHPGLGHTEIHLPLASS